MYLYKRELFEIHSCSLLPRFSGICCLFGSGLEWTLPIFSLHTIPGYFSPFGSHGASFLMASLCLPFSLMRYPISHPTVRDHEAFALATHCYQDHVASWGVLIQPCGFSFKKKQSVFLFACDNNKNLTRRPTYLPVLPVREVFVSSLYHQSLNSHTVS